MKKIADEKTSFAARRLPLPQLLPNFFGYGVFYDEAVFWGFFSYVSVVGDHYGYAVFESCGY